MSGHYSNDKISINKNDGFYHFHHHSLVAGPSDNTTTHNQVNQSGGGSGGSGGVKGKHNIELVDKILNQISQHQQLTTSSTTNIGNKSEVRCISDGHNVGSRGGNGEQFVRSRPVTGDGNVAVEDSGITYARKVQNQIISSSSSYSGDNQHHQQSRGGGGGGQQNYRGGGGGRFKSKYNSGSTTYQQAFGRGRGVATFRSNALPTPGITVSKQTEPCTRCEYLFVDGQLVAKGTCTHVLKPKSVPHQFAKEMKMITSRSTEIAMSAQVERHSAKVCKDYVVINRSRNNNKKSTHMSNNFFSQNKTINSYAHRVANGGDHRKMNNFANFNTKTDNSIDSIGTHDNMNTIIQCSSSEQMKKFVEAEIVFGHDMIDVVPIQAADPDHDQNQDQNQKFNTKSIELSKTNLVDCEKPKNLLEKIPHQDTMQSEREIVNIATVESHDHIENATQDLSNNELKNQKFIMSVLQTANSHTEPYEYKASLTNVNVNIDQPQSHFNTKSHQMITTKSMKLRDQIKQQPFNDDNNGGNGNGTAMFTSHPQHSLYQWLASRNTTNSISNTLRGTVLANGNVSNNVVQKGGVGGGGGGNQSSLQAVKKVRCLITNFITIQVELDSGGSISVSDTSESNVEAENHTAGSGGGPLSVSAMEGTGGAVMEDILHLIDREKLGFQNFDGKNIGLYKNIGYINRNKAKFIRPTRELLQLILHPRVLPLLVPLEVNTASGIGHSDYSAIQERQMLSDAANQLDLSAFYDYQNTGSYQTQFAYQVLKKLLDDDGTLIGAIKDHLTTTTTVHLHVGGGPTSTDWECYSSEDEDCVHDGGGGGGGGMYVLHHHALKEIPSNLMETNCEQRQHFLSSSSTTTLLANNDSSSSLPPTNDQYYPFTVTRFSDSLLYGGRPLAELKDGTGGGGNKVMNTYWWADYVQQQQKQQSKSNGLPPNFVITEVSFAID